MLTSILKTATALSLLATAGWAAMTGNTVNVATGTTITRTWEQIQAANYAYAPMQTYTASSHTTKVYLPYDNTDGVYYNYSNIIFSTTAFNYRSFVNGYAPAPCSVTYKLHFDATISDFSLHNAYILANTLSAGDTLNIDYSTNGTDWSNLWSRPSGEYATINNQATGLATQDLYLRYGTSGPTAGSYWMNMATAGDKTTNYNNFVGGMGTLTVTSIPEPAALSLLALGGLALLRRRPRA